MAEKAGDGAPLSVESICVSTQADCSARDCDNVNNVSNEEFSLEELYKHALQFYKGKHVVHASLIFHLSVCGISRHKLAPNKAHCPL